ncbi:MAG TPA: alpha/beta fold hydrolase [Allosphingosinicella sp.]
MRSETIELANGLSTRLADTGGAGTPVVLVHGLANSIEIWDRVLPRLARSFRTIAFDLPGFGEASRPDAAYDGPFFAAQLKALLDRLALNRAHLVGSSLGASAIVHFSGIGLDRIDKAVLAAPGGFGRRTHPIMRIPSLPLIGAWLGRPTRSNNRMTIRLAMHDQGNATEELIALIDRYAAIPGSERSFVRTLREGVGLLGSRKRAEVERLARGFDRPALLLWGNQDRVFPPEQGERAAALLPRARLELIDACGHYPQWEQPDAFAAALERFLGSSGPA